MKKFKVQLTTLIVLVLGLIGPVTAQTSKGFVVGTVEDQNGASIPSATIKITNLATGVVRDTVADTSGSFQLDAVKPGAYTLAAGRKGFKTNKVDRVEVKAAQTVTVPLRLEIGSPTEE